ncbi:MAG: SseB family protein [Lachnospiraceae bacterium]
MGLFQFFKKKNKDQEEAVVDVQQETGIEQKKEPAARKYTNEEDRRLVMLVEETFESQHNDGIVTVGTVQGTVKNGDALFLLEPDGKITMVNVVGLAIQENGVMKPVDEAADQVVGVKIYDISGRKQVARYAVLTSIKPVSDVRIPTGIENPYVLGLAYGYFKFGNRKEYSDILLAELLRAHFLAAVYMEKPEGTESEDGGTGLTADMTISFPGLEKKDASGRADFALFTDWNELSYWKNVFDETHPPKTMILQMADCFDMVSGQKDGQMPGIVINAFGQKPIVLTAQMIQSIRHSEIYQKIVTQQRQEKTE